MGPLPMPLRSGAGTVVNEGSPFARLVDAEGMIVEFAGQRGEEVYDSRQSRPRQPVCLGLKGSIEIVRRGQRVASNRLVDGRGRAGRTRKRRRCGSRQQD